MRTHTPHHSVEEVFSAFFPETVELPFRVLGYDGTATGPPRADVTIHVTQPDALRYLITRVGGKQASLEYLSVSDKVDESLLKMPEGYTVCTKGTDGKLYDASGKAVD